MAAHEHLQGEQLAMFMPARTLINYVSQESDENLPYSKDTELHDHKMRESKGSGLLEEIRERGVEKPIEVFVDNPNKAFQTNHQITDGHHRIASANNINPNMEIPVKHYSAEHWDY